MVTTDDQVVSAFNRHSMPFTWRYFHDNGTVFETSLAAPPLCCPDRAGFITGDYPHDSGVFGNTPGYPTLTDPQNVLPAWLDRAGYETGLVGKYLNGYNGPAPAPGWDQWFAFTGTDSYYDYEISHNGTLQSYGQRPSDYSTRVLTGDALGFLHKASQGSQPFFLWLTYNAPHLEPGNHPPPCTGASAQLANPADFNPYAHTQLPHPPNYDEKNISDKPAWFQHLRPLTIAETKQDTVRWRCELAAVGEVDDSMKTLISALRRQGQLQNTILVFDSDNGFFFGEHRLDDDKRLAYEPSLRVPLAISVPAALRGGRSQPRRVGEPVANIDLPATLLDYANVKPCIAPGECRVLDGRSLRPLLAGQNPGWARRRAILVELNDGYTYEALRSRRYLYVEMTADRRGTFKRPAVELYDLRHDPYELHNLRRTDRAGSRALRQKLAARLHTLERCSGTRADPSPTRTPPCQ